VFGKDIQELKGICIRPVNLATFYSYMRKKTILTSLEN